MLHAPKFMYKTNIRKNYMIVLSPCKHLIHFNIHCLQKCWYKSYPDKKTISVRSWGVLFRVNLTKEQNNTLHSTKLLYAFIPFSFPANYALTHAVGRDYSKNSSLQCRTLRGCAELKTTELPSFSTGKIFVFATFLVNKCIETSTYLSQKQDMQI